MLGNPGGTARDTTRLAATPIWSQISDATHSWDVLLNAGANPTLEDDLYHGTPAGWARNRGHTALAERLQTLA